MSSREVQPLYLLADSQVLFWHSPAGPFLPTILKSSELAEPRIAYIGASNGDSKEAHTIFAAAAEQVKGARAHWVRSSYEAEDREFLETADVVVLAGGDVEAGWNIFNKTGMAQQIKTLYKSGAVIIGVSAGAVQCGTHAALSVERGTSRLVEMFGFVQFIVDVHDEKQQWHTLSSTIHLLEGGAMGLGIPSGGGLAVYPDGTLEPVKSPVDHFTFSDHKLRRAVLVPEP